MNLQIAKYIIVALAIVSALYLGCSKLIDVGYNNAKEHYEPIIRKYEDQQLAKISSVEGLVKGLVSNNDASAKALTEDIATIKNNLKGKTLVIYKDGKCSLSKEFLDSRADAINKANQR